MTDQIETPETTVQVIIVDDSLNDHHIRGLELAHAALVADLAVSTHPDRFRSAGWRESYKLNNAVTCDQLVKKGYMEAAPENKKTTAVQNRYRITTDGCAAIVLADPRPTKPADTTPDISADTPPVTTADTPPAKNPDAHIATLTSPEISPSLATGKGQGDGDNFCDSDSMTVADGPPTHYELAREIDVIVAGVIGRTHPVEITHVVENVAVLAQRFTEAEDALTTAMTELNKKQMLIEQLQQKLIDAQLPILPPITEANALRSRVVGLESDNAGLRIEIGLQGAEISRLRNELRTAQNRRLDAGERSVVSATPTTPEIEVMFFDQRIRNPEEKKQAAEEIAALLNDGWEIKHEHITQDSAPDYYRARLQRNKPAQPSQPLRAAAEVSVPVGVPVTAIAVPSSSISIRMPESPAVPVVNTLAICDEEDTAFVDMPDYSEALDKLMAGQITPAQFATISDNHALTVGFNAYRQAVTS